MPKQFKNPSYETAMTIKRLLSTTSSVLGCLPTTAKPDGFASISTFDELDSLVEHENNADTTAQSSQSGPVDEQQWSYDSLEVSKANANKHTRDLVRCQACHKLLLPQRFAAHYGTFLSGCTLVCSFNVSLALTLITSSATIYLDFALRSIMLLII